MTIKDWVDIAQFALNGILAIFTLTLFRQGQKDRRKVRSDQERDQASKVSLIRGEVTKPSPGGGHSIEAVTVEIRNDSTLPITAAEWEDLNLGDAHYRGLAIPGGQSIRFPLKASHIVWNFELYFVDGAGKPWVRRDSDGTLWVNTDMHMPLRWWQNWYHRRAVGKLGKVFSWPTNYAFRRTVKIAPRIPQVARITRFLWGSATPATPDPQPWRRTPYVSERDWPYQNLINMALYLQCNAPSDTQ
ncbi:hypothetical protein [Paenarthrobacter nitroguajacolicus]|uniref:hypothetical protein n=1 Tax=Paenarthrobacter nitroguajacolicus TaxID=211146 RepID=UPI0015BEEA2A|nr:hypothetical protein [Paenarthrobacter nitroguajacolicus]NWL32659.1 hypothetical protein [Paenarthrobacter nitroguajacolicus]